MADQELPQPVAQGIAALQDLLGGDDVLKRVGSRTGELASFDFVLPPDFSGQLHTAEIGFPRTFPQSGLRVRISPSAFLDWPHVMADSVCLFGGHDKPVGGTPVEVVTKTIGQLGALITMMLPTTPQAKRDNDFHREIRSYWIQQFVKHSQFQLVLADIPAAAQPLFALTDVQLRRGVETVALASHADGLCQVCSRFGVRVGAIKAPAAAGFYLPLTEMPSVRIPQSHRLVEWLQEAASSEDIGCLQEWLAAQNYPFRFLILRLPHAQGPPAFQALSIRGHGLAEAARPQYGRRAQRRRPVAPAPIRLARIDGAVLHVLAPEVVHSRAPDGQQLQKAHVVLVGVGSLGGFLAMNLARAGVGRLTLIDPEVLEAENLGRHVLGTRHLGEGKATALSEQLNVDVPTVQVEGIKSYVQIDGEQVRKAFNTATLVLVSTADWASELWLWQLKVTGAPWSLVQVWSEPHAVAGHALVSPENSSEDPRPLFDNTGEFRRRFSDWHDGGVVPLPACGGSYIPGGPVALSAIAAMGAQACIDTLTNEVPAPRWYSLVKSAGAVEAAGGVYKGPALNEGAASQIFVRGWPGSIGGAA